MFWLTNIPWKWTKNKIYSSDTCCLVPQEINKLLISCEAARGEFPIGVFLSSNGDRYYSAIRINGKSKHLGSYKRPKEAHKNYVLAKEAHVKEKALEWQDRISDNVFQALMNWKVGL